MSLSMMEKVGVGVGGDGEDHKPMGEGQWG